MSVGARSAPSDPSLLAAPIAWETLGESRDGRPVRAVTVGSRLSATGGGVQRLAVIAGIHGNEREGGRHLDEVLELLKTARASVRVYEDVNPDGTWRRSRGTTKGVDPNRNWPAKNFRSSRERGPEPLSEPGVRAVHNDLVRFSPELVIVLHSTSRGPFVNFDGPALGWAECFASAARETGFPWDVQPSMGYPTPGSLGSWMGVDRNVPILTIEFQRGSPASESGPALLAGLRAILASNGQPPVETFQVR